MDKKNSFSRGTAYDCIQKKFAAMMTDVIMVNNGWWNKKAYKKYISLY